VLVTSSDVAKKYFGSAQKRKLSAMAIGTESRALKTQSSKAEADTTHRWKKLQKLQGKIVSVMELIQVDYLSKSVS